MRPSTYCALNRLATMWNAPLALSVGGRDGDSFVIRHSGFIIRECSRVSARASSFLFRDIFRCADWLQLGSAPARSFPNRSPPGPQLSWDYWGGTGTAARQDRKESERQARNRAGQLRIRVSRWPLRCRVLPPAICKRGFLPPTRYHGPPVAYKSERPVLPPRFAAAPRAIDFRNRTGVTRKRRQ